MPEPSLPDRVHTFVIRGETLRGTTHDILLELDREILGLLVLRQKLVDEGAVPDPAARRTGIAHDCVRRITKTLGCTHG